MPPGWCRAATGLEDGQSFTEADTEAAEMDPGLGALLHRARSTTAAGPTGPTRCGSA